MLDSTVQLLVEVIRDLDLHFLTHTFPHYVSKHFWLFRLLVQLDLLLDGQF